MPVFSEDEPVFERALRCGILQFLQSPVSGLLQHFLQAVSDIGCICFDPINVLAEILILEFPIVYIVISIPS